MICGGSEVRKYPSKFLINWGIILATSASEGGNLDIFGDSPQPPKKSLLQEKINMLKDVKELEDFLVHELDGWNDYVAALVYALLYHRNNMRIDHARHLLKKAHGISSFQENS